MTMFAWQNFLFRASTKRSRLVIYCRHLQSLCSDQHNSHEGDGFQDCGDFGMNDSSAKNFDHEEERTWKCESNESDHDNGKRNVSSRISLDFGNSKKCKLVQTGFCYHEDSFQKMPICLVKCYDSRKSEKSESASSKTKSKQTQEKVDYFIIGLKQNCHVTQVCENDPSLFALQPLKRLPYVGKNVQFCIVSCGVVIFDKDLKLFQISSLSGEDDKKPLHDLHIPSLSRYLHGEMVTNFLDATHDYDLGTAIMCSHFKGSINNDEITMVCSSHHIMWHNIKVPNPNSGESAHISNDPVQTEEIMIEHFFPPEYAKILKAVKMSSVKSNGRGSWYNQAVLISITGFALRFVNGKLETCVHLSELISESFSEDEGRKQKRIKMVDIEGYTFSTTAVLVDEDCFLVNWTNQKVIRSWSSVIDICSCDPHQRGIPALALLQSSHQTDDAPWNAQELNDGKVFLVDVDLCEGSGKEDGESVSMSYRFREDAEWPEVGGLCHGEEDGQSPQDVPTTKEAACAAKALTAQKKRFQAYETDSKSVLKNKEAFLKDMWRTLSRADSTTGQARSEYSLNQNSLIPLVKGLGMETAGLTNVRAGSPEVIEIWKRTVGTLVVVGVVVSGFKSAICDARLILCPPSFEHLSPTKEFISSSRPCIPSAENQLKRNTSDHTQPSCSLHKSRNSLIFQDNQSFKGLGKPFTLTSYFDLSCVSSSTDAKIHVFLDYSERQLETREGRGPIGDGGAIENKLALTQMYCGELIMSVDDVLSQQWSVGKHLEEKPECITEMDIQALDTVQISKLLVVSSQVTSVSALATGLNKSEAVTFVDWLNQYIFFPNHLLGLCRLQVGDQLSKHRCHLQVWASHTQQMLMVVQWLYALLPRDVQVLPSTSSHSQQLETVRRVGASLVEEVSRTCLNLTTCLSAKDKEKEEENGKKEEPVEKIESPQSPCFHSRKRKV